jgi:hypothetical protein
VPPPLHDAVRGLLGRRRVFDVVDLVVAAWVDAVERVAGLNGAELFEKLTSTDAWRGKLEGDVRVMAAIPRPGPIAPLLCTA